MIKFAVCDNEKDMTEYISEKLLEYYPDKCEIKKYTNSKSLLKDSRHESFDAYFLDIGMPLLDGFETAKRIRSDNSRAKIIFVTKKEELAHLGYIYDAFRFVRKSKLDQELCEAAESLSKYLSDTEEFMNFKNWRGKILVDIKTVRYFKADGHCIILYGPKEKRIYDTMQKLEEQLKNKGFIRIHKSYLVNLRFFYSIDSTGLTLFSGEKLPVSRNRIFKVKDMINQYCKFRDNL